ncbi:MAG: NAD(P)-binding domain-containing protein [Anaerolineae bacterium]|nr:NAD(P)-binding domain-containing protein [Anaerolineae bacterium]
MTTTYNTIVIGGGQAGLAAGYFLTQQGEEFVILDGASATGETWRKRWDSLRLFTPSLFDSLPGMPFPKPDDYAPTKDEVADYLTVYAETFHLPVRHGVKVSGLARNGVGYQILATDAHYSARHVIIATGAYQQPRVPAFAGELGAGIHQLHSSAYRNPEQVTAGTVLVVGAGNSGAEIALELAHAGKQVWLAGRDVGRIPADALSKLLGSRTYWWLLGRVLSVDTPIGRKMRSNVLYHGNPLIRGARKNVISAGVKCTPRVSGIQSGQPHLEDGQVLPVEAVIWATGFRPEYSWIDLPVFDERGFPRHRRGVVQEAPGLYFVGLHFQTAITSALLGGVGQDAGAIVRHITA